MAVITGERGTRGWGVVPVGWRCTDGRAAPDARACWSNRRQTAGSSSVTGQLRALVLGGAEMLPRICRQRISARAKRYLNFNLDGKQLDQTDWLYMYFVPYIGLLGTYGRIRRGSGARVMCAQRANRIGRPNNDLYPTRLANKLTRICVDSNDASQSRQGDTQQQACHQRYRCSARTGSQQ